MKNFLKKELKLGLAPVNFVYLAFVVMIIIPNYPRYVPFYFFGISLLYIFNNARFNKDLEYSMILPITKKEIVKSRCILVCAYEIFFILLSVPFSILQIKSGMPENQAGIECNYAFYGLMLILITFYTFTFFVSYYKKADKPGMPFLKASIIFWVLFFVLETPIWIKNQFNLEFAKKLDDVSGAYLPFQLTILAIGITFFIIGWILTYLISARRFEKVDL